MLSVICAPPAKSNDPALGSLEGFPAVVDNAAWLKVEGEVCEKRPNGTKPWLGRRTRHVANILLTGAGTPRAQILERFGKTKFHPAFRYADGRTRDKGFHMNHKVFFCAAAVLREGQPARYVPVHQALHAVGACGRGGLSHARAPQGCDEVQVPEPQNGQVAP